MRPPCLSPASSLLLLAESLGFGAHWLSRSCTHWGEGRRPGRKAGAVLRVSTESWQGARCQQLSDGDFQTPQSRQSGAPLRAGPQPETQKLGGTILTRLEPRKCMPSHPASSLSLMSKLLASSSTSLQSLCAVTAHISHQCSHLFLRPTFPGLSLSLRISLHVLRKLCPHITSGA